TEAEPWDMVVVDEAHHLNADEERGPTLGYRLIEKLQEGGRVRSMVFFTGTPHRGKNYGFFALLRLLRPDLFDPRKPAEEHLPRLRGVMVRNNKHEVTDLTGTRLFHEPVVRSGHPDREGLRPDHRADRGAGGDARPDRDAEARVELRRRHPPRP